MARHHRRCIIIFPDVKTCNLTVFITVMKTAGLITFDISLSAVSSATRTSSARPSEALPKRNDNFDPFHLFTNTGHYQSYRQHQSEGRGEPVPPEVIPKFSATRSRH